MSRLGVNYCISAFRAIPTPSPFFRKFVSRLPDKGEKIISFHDKILKELEHRNEVEEAANALSRLNIASEGKAAMSKLEWTGKYNDKEDEDTKIVELDSDDEEDPLKLLAQVDRSCMKYR